MKTYKIYYPHVTQETDSPSRAERMYWEAIAAGVQFVKLIKNGVLVKQWTNKGIELIKPLNNEKQDFVVIGTGIERTAAQIHANF